VFNAQIHSRGIWSGFNETDLYRILQVSRSSSQTEIKKAYFKLAKECHPDINPSPAARTQFHRIAAAYEVLGNEDKRRTYDATGQHENQAHFNQGANKSYSPEGDFADEIFKRVWQELGVQEYVQTVKSEASTALEAARHGDYSFAWDVSCTI